MSPTNKDNNHNPESSRIERFEFPPEGNGKMDNEGNEKNPLTSDEDTNLVSPEERARWESVGLENRLAVNMRPLLSEHGSKGPVSGAQWPTHDIGDLLGEGGMAAVYLARRRDNGHIVALKVLPARLAEDPASRKRFEREAQISQTINSEHVVKVWDAGRYGPLCYLEMEFVDGASLGDDIKRRRELRDKPFTSDEVIEIALQAADALLEAGKLQLVHRDIKPGNLMRTREGQIKLADFGIVKVLGEEAMTMTGTAMGTPTYMSPEQGRGDTVDVRADYYSLGVVMYELLTLKQPFEESTADALIYQHHFVEPKLITELAPDCLLGLEAVVFTCLQKFPDRRYPDAETLIRDLNLLKSGYPPEFAVFHKGRVRTGADEALARHGGGWRRYWKRALVGMVALVLAVGLGVWWLLASRAQADSLRIKLTVLDTPQAIPITASSDVERLQRLVGTRDEQVLRWIGKLSQVEELRTQLSEIPIGSLTHEIIQKISISLKSYQDLCGSSEPIVTNWQMRLADAARDHREATQALTELDQQSNISKSLIDRLDPLFAIARNLSAKDNSDIARWETLLAAAKQRIIVVQERLKIVDDVELLTVTQQQSARKDLTIWTTLMGAADNDGLRWSEKVTQAERQLQILRQTLTQFDGGDVLPLSVARGLETEWQRFSIMAGPTDSDVMRWRQRMQEAQERSATLSKKLSILNEDNFFSINELESLQIDLDAYRIINGNIQETKNWQVILSEAKNKIATLRQVLASLVDKEQLTQNEQQLLRSTATTLTQQKALNQAELERVNARLARDEARLLLLIERLSILDQQTDIDDRLRSLLDEFERLADVDNPKVGVWRKKLNAITELRSRLTALNEQQAFNKDAAQDLAHLITLVGATPTDVRRWGEKISAVQAHKTALAILNEPGPVDDNAVDRLARLIVLVGELDPDIQRWQQKLTDITRLKARLRSLNETYILPPTAIDDAQALQDLVGKTDPVVVQAHARVRILRGPERPAWASDYGRDEYGLFADLTIMNQVQRLRYIPSGSFTLGSPPQEKSRELDENSVAVKLTRSFWLADSECAQGLWQEIKQANPGYNKHDFHPVERVSWHDAQHFFKILNIRIKKNINSRLPTEAEWEFAARAGATGALPGHDAPGADDIDRIAIHEGTTNGTSRAIRGRLPNRLGLYDMLGNVWEWCQDTYAPYPVVPTTDPRSTVGSKRVVRGGSWGDKSGILRVADRHALAPDIQSAYVGLRIAIDVEWGDK